MLYYKVKEQYDNRPIYKCDIGYATLDRNLIANELYTRKELLRYRIPLKCVDEIQISQRKTYRFFWCKI